MHYTFFVGNSTFLCVVDIHQPSMNIPGKGTVQYAVLPAYIVACLTVSTYNSTLCVAVLLV